MVHILDWGNDIHACNKGFMHNSNETLRAKTLDPVRMHSVEQNRDKMGSNTGSTNMAKRIIRLKPSETEMIACGRVLELDAF